MTTALREQWIIGDTVVGDARVSTVWLGPVTGRYETQVFGGSLNGSSWLSATFDAAVDRHDVVVTLLKERAK